MKIIVKETLPTRDDRYEDIVKFLLEYKPIWLVDGVQRKCFKDFKRPDNGNSLTKSELIDLVRDNFELSEELRPKRTYNQDIKEDAYDYYIITYIGKGFMKNIQVEDAPPINLVKGVPVSVYSKDCHLLEIARDDADIVVVACKWNTDWKETLKSVDRIRTFNRDSDKTTSFFKVW